MLKEMRLDNLVPLDHSWKNPGDVLPGDRVGYCVSVGTRPWGEGLVISVIDKDALVMWSKNPWLTVRFSGQPLTVNEHYVKQGQKLHKEYEREIVEQLHRARENSLCELIDLQNAVTGSPTNLKRMDRSAEQTQCRQRGVDVRQDPDRRPVTARPVGEAKDRWDHRGR